MFAFIKKHWIAYLICAAIAVLIGYGASLFLGARWSTPADLRAQRIEAEQKAQDEMDDSARTEDIGSSAG